MDPKCGVICADAKWLQTEFFARYATRASTAGIRLIVPADTLFLTPPMLDKVNWASQHSCGPAWQKAVTAALTPEKMSLQTHYAALKQRFPQMLAAAGGENKLVCQHMQMSAVCTVCLPPHLLSELVLTATWNSDVFSTLTDGCNGKATHEASYVE